MLSDSVMSDSLWLHGLQHARLPCPTLSPRVYSNSCPDAILCHPLLLPSIIPRIRVFFNAHFQALRIRWPKYWSFSISPSNEYPGLISFRIDWLISLQSKGLSRVFSSTTIWKHQIFGIQPSLWSNYQISTWLLEKPVLTIGTYVGKIMSLLFNTLSRFPITFLPRSKYLSIS